MLLWTGQRWIISLSKNNEAKSIYEKTLEQRSSTISSYKATDLAKKLRKLFQMQNSWMLERIKMNNFSDMLSKAKAMQDKMREAQEKIKTN